MFSSIFITFSLLTSILTEQIPQVNHGKLLAQRSFSLEDRYPNKWVSGVFKDNILLALAYLRGYSKNSGEVNWSTVEKPFHYEMTLEPGEMFAFHDDLLPQFKVKEFKTIPSHFNSFDGYKSDGWLVGDGVCHLASFINWVAQDAKLDVLSPTRHDFAAIPEVPREYGTSIYANLLTKGYNSSQNLYITNNKGKEISIAFDYDGANLKVSVEE